MELKFDLAFPFNQEELSALEREILFEKQDILVATATERILRDTNSCLYEGHKPNPEATYAQGMFKLGLRLCQKYDPTKVELAMKKYVPDLF